MDAISKGSKVLLIDDVLATGGTIGAAIELIHRAGGEVSHVLALLEIEPNHCEIRLLLKSLNALGHIEMEPIKSAVANTGKTALIPGKAVFSSKLKVAIAIPITPNHGVNRFLHTYSGTKRSNAPTPNSQPLPFKE